MTNAEAIYVLKNTPLGVMSGTLTNEDGTVMGKGDELFPKAKARAIDALEKVEAIKLLLWTAEGQGIVRVEDDGTEHEIGKEELYEVVLHKMKEVIIDGEKK